MKKLIRTLKQISILFLAITLFGCEDDDTNLPKVSAGFTYTINADTGVVTFINLSIEATSYIWDFGDESSSTLINPVKAYENGTYTIVLTASAESGSSATFEDEITILIPEIATLPITFDGQNTKYDAGVFAGAKFAVVDNPAPGGSNETASKVGAITNSGATFEGIVFELGAAINLTTEKTIKMDFWSDEPVSVTVKLEISENVFTDVTVSHGGTGWEELSFNFSASGTYPKLVIFVDGSGTTSGTFYFDNITQEVTPAPPCTPEIAQSLLAADFNVTFQAENTTSTILDDGATMIRILNPDTDNDVNSSCQVGQITRNPDFQYANNQFEFDSKLDFDANAGFKLKVWSSTIGTKVAVKIEDKALGNTGPFAEVVVETTVESGWEELTFAFASGESNKFDRIVLFFNSNTNTPGTFYIDDFALYARAGSACIPETTQSFTGADFNLTFATDPGSTLTVGATETLFLEDVGYIYADNPDDTSTINSSCKVAEISKAAENYPNLQIFTTSKFNFTDNAGFKLKTYSPNAGINILMKLEDTNNGATFNQVSKLTTVANGWEELTFDFPEADTNKFDRIILFFGFEQPTALTISFDDLKLYPRSGGGGGTSGGFPINFEDGVNIFSAFEGATVGVIDNPQTTGNPSSKVMELIKPVGSPFFAGINSSQGLGAPLVDLANGMIFTVKIWSPKSNVDVRMRLEQEPGVIDPPAYQIFQTLSNANEWVTLTFDFTDQAMPSYTYTRLVLNTDWANGGDGQPFYIDDIEQSGPTSGGGGTGGGGTGGGGGGAVDGGIAVNGDFETGDTTGYTIFDGQGGVFTVTNEEAQAGTYSGKLVAGEGKEIVIKQANLNTSPPIGTGVSVTISFDLKGSITGDGGVVFAEFFSEKSPEGVSKAEILGLNPLVPTNTWTNYTFTTTTGDDVSGGVTLQLKAACGAVAGCGVIAYFDNVSITINP